jgi:hypothetical protein
MKNILNFIDQWGLRITFLLVLIVFMKTCTTNGKVERVEKRITQKTEKLDSLLKTVDGKIVTEDKLIKLIKETPNWKTLELEELSDKNRIPINKLKNDNEK